MTDCKVKINVDICGESALDAVTNLVVNKGIGINAACKQVAEDFNSSNEGATVKWGTLKKSYQRANKPTGDMSPPKPKKIPMVVPETVVANTTTIDTTALEAEIAALKISNEELVNTMLDQEAEIIQLKEQLKGYQPQVDAIPNDTVLPPIGKLPREVAYSFIEKEGSNFQTAALKMDNLTNEKMFKLFKAVLAKVLEHTPPQMLPKELIEATELV